MPYFAIIWGCCRDMSIDSWTDLFTCRNESTLGPSQVQMTKKRSALHRERSLNRIGSTYLKGRKSLIHMTSPGLRVTGHTGKTSQSTVWGLGGYVTLEVLRQGRWILPEPVWPFWPKSRSPSVSHPPPFIGYEQIVSLAHIQARVILFHWKMWKDLWHVLELL